jgi:hypothetical protein
MCFTRLHNAITQNFLNPTLFAICNSTFSKLCKQCIHYTLWYVEECSVALLCNCNCNSVTNRSVVASRNETCKLNLTNSNYQYSNYTRNLVGRSFGRCLLNRLLSGSFMRFANRPFGCALRRALYWELQQQISSLTVGVWRSLRITVFGMFQGASTIIRKALIGSVLGFLCWKWKLYYSLKWLLPKMLLASRFKKLGCLHLTVGVYFIWFQTHS